MIRQQNKYNINNTILVLSTIFRLRFSAENITKLTRILK